MIIYEDMSQRSLQEFFSPASTSGNGSKDDSESEEEEEQQHAPSNSVRRSHSYKCYVGIPIEDVDYEAARVIFDHQPRRI